ncbi:hypothetical protein [Streptomyces sp. SID8352]|uniref:hypothetical protein n=1 Tax=Streptomyces sp. SID8352 TaxID=2690338 RepID=UPI00137169C1|nr:hypothetical protein [Streptomyces sp. SID8352]MYU20686.1 hypothetical protein [Streptomyces sp. SID8352]
MSETTARATELASQYTAQVSGDLEHNVREQERIGAEITALQQRLAALQHDHALLVNMQQALGLTAPAAPERGAPATGAPAAGDESTGRVPAAAVPAPRVSDSAEPAHDEAAGTAPEESGAKESGAEGTGTEESAPAAKSASARATGGRKRVAGRSSAKSPTGPGGKPSAKKPSAAKPAAKKPATRKAPAKKPAATEAAPAPAAEASAKPTLVELVRAHLAGQGEPRSAAEVTQALGTAGLGRTVKTTVVRSTLEGLVARNQAQRTKQGTSVYYTATDAPSAAPDTAVADA